MSSPSSSSKRSWIRKPHGRGFVARLSGVTAEFLSMWATMMAGRQPFFMRDGQLHLALQPALPAWLFDEQNQLSFRFLGHTTVTIHNPARLDTWQTSPSRAVLTPANRAALELPGALIGPPYAAMVRSGQIEAIHIYFE